MNGLTRTVRVQLPPELNLKDRRSREPLFLTVELYPQMCAERFSIDIGVLAKEYAIPVEDARKNRDVVVKALRETAKDIVEGQAALNQGTTPYIIRSVIEEFETSMRNKQDIRKLTAILLYPFGVLSLAMAATVFGIAKGSDVIAMGLFGGISLLGGYIIRSLMKKLEKGISAVLKQTDDAINAVAEEMGHLLELEILE